MYTVFLAGGTASGKSTVARELERLGAWRIDLDELSRAVLAPGEPCVAEVCAAFGDDLVDPGTGALDRALLAQVGVYFLFPLVVAVAHAAVALSVVNDIVALLTGFQIGTALVGTVAFVVALYGGYFLVTYLTSRNMIVRA